MTIVVPAARKFSEQTGEYDLTDEATSGGDIGVQIALFPVVWVRADSVSNTVANARSHEQSDRMNVVVLPPQLKGSKHFHGAQRATWTRSNVVLECGWVASSSNRRDWIFVQNDSGDMSMSKEGKLQYNKLNNLGARKLHAQHTRACAIAAHA